MFYLSINTICLSTRPPASWRQDWSWCWCKRQSLVQLHLRLRWGTLPAGMEGFFFFEFSIKHYSSFMMVSFLGWRHNNQSGVHWWRVVPGWLERETGSGSQKLHPSTLIDPLSGNLEYVPSADVTLIELNLFTCFNFFMVNKLEAFWFIDHLRHLVASFSPKLKLKNVPTLNSQ